MAYTLTIPIDADQTGLTFTAQLTDENGDPVGGTITGGTYEAVGDDYEWTYDAFPDSFTAGHVVFTDNNNDTYSSQIYDQASEVTDPGSEWYYASTDDVIALIGEENMDIIFDADDQNGIDPGAVVAAGVEMDSYIDLKLRRAGLTAPNPLTDTTIAAVLRSASKHLTAWAGFKKRGLAELNAAGVNAKFADEVAGYKEYADSLIDGVIETLELEDADDSTTTAGSFGFVPIVRDYTTNTADENSSN
jgi:hypothetical protein